MPLAPGFARGRFLARLAPGQSPGLTGCILIAALLLLPATPAPAQRADNPLLNPQPNNPPAQNDNPLLQPAKPIVELPEPTQLLDIRLLLSWDQVTKGTIEDPIWAFTQSPGRTLILIPVRIPRVAEDAKLANPAITLRGGRFLCWAIPSAEEHRKADEAAGVARDGDTRGLDFQDPLLMNQDFDLGGSTRPPGDGSDDADRAPASAPRLVRDMVFGADGTVTWPLERALPGADVKEGQEPYMLKLRGDRMRELEPQRVTIQRNQGESSRDYAARRRAEQEAQRDAQIEFRDLRNLVRELPDEFTEPAPTLVWAVFETPEGLRELSLAGPEPLPWTLTFDEFQTLRELAGTQVGAEPTFNDYKKLVKVQGLGRSEHPYSHRALAYTLHDAGMIGKAKPKDPLHRLLEGIIDGPDAGARSIVLRDLVGTIPPTASTKMLLTDAAEHLTAEMKLESLRGALSAGSGDSAEALNDAVAAADAALRDPQGPAPGQVLAALEGVVAAKPEQFPALISAIDLFTLPEHRRDAALAYIIRTAGQSPLSDQWLTQGLLGSPDPAKFGRTLELLAAASGDAGALVPAVDQLLAALFGPPRADAGTRLDLTIAEPIKITSASHPIFRSLNSGDTATRELAWRALPNFSVAPGTGGSAPDTSDPVDMILVSALGRAQTPPQVVPFLDQLADEARATAALVRIVVEGDSRASGRAARTLMGSDRTLTIVVGQLPPTDRLAFAARCYEAVGQAPPRTIGLMREPQVGGAGIVTWFSKRVQEPGMPTALDWANAADSEATLLRFAADRDVSLASGAVAALVAQAGGDEATAAAVYDDWAAQADRSVAALTIRWAEARRGIFRKRIEAAAGAYRLVLMIPEAREGDPPPGFEPFETPEPSAEDATPRPVQKIVVGVVELSVEKDTVRIANGTIGAEVPEDRLAIRIRALDDIKGIAKTGLAQIKLEAYREPIDLLPQDDGSWLGRFILPGRGPSEVRLEPAAQ